MQPAIVPLEPCCPDNRSNVVGCQIDGSGRRIERKTSGPGLGGRPDGIDSIFARNGAVTEPPGWLEDDPID